MCQRVCQYLSTDNKFIIALVSINFGYRFLLSYSIQNTSLFLREFVLHICMFRTRAQNRHYQSSSNRWDATSNIKYLTWSQVYVLSHRDGAAVRRFRVFIYIKRFVTFVIVQLFERCPMHNSYWTFELLVVVHPLGRQLIWSEWRAHRVRILLPWDIKFKNSAGFFFLLIPNSESGKKIRFADICSPQKTISVHMFVDKVSDFYTGMKKEISPYDENFYYSPMPPIQPVSVLQQSHAQLHNNLTSIEETIFQILGKPTNDWFRINISHRFPSSNVPLPAQYD